MPMRPHPPRRAKAIVALPVALALLVSACSATASSSSRQTVSGIHVAQIAIPVGSPVFLGGASFGNGNGLLTFNPQVPFSNTPKHFFPPDSALLAGVSSSGQLRPLLTVAQGRTLMSPYKHSGGIFVTSASFINAEDGWAALWSGASALGVVARTTNGGRSWAKIQGSYSAGNGSSLIVSAASTAAAWLEVTPAGGNESDYFYHVTGAGQQVQPVCLCDGGPTLVGVLGHNSAVGAVETMDYLPSTAAPVAFFIFSGTKSTTWSPANPVRCTLAVGDLQGQPEIAGVVTLPYRGINNVVVETDHTVRTKIRLSDSRDVPSAAFGPHGSLLVGWVTEQGDAKLALFAPGQSRPYKTANLGSILPKHGGVGPIGAQPLSVQRAGSSFLVLSSASLRNFGVLKRAWIVSG